MPPFARKIALMKHVGARTRFLLILFVFVLGGTGYAAAQMPTPVTNGLGTATIVPPSAPPAAQTAVYDTLPIEVALLHSKLLKEEPVYDFFIFANPTFDNSDMTFSRMALMDKERDKLKKIYDDMAEDMLIRTTTELEIAGLNPETQAVSLVAPTSAEPILFDLYGKVTYGVFIRNAADMATLTPPFEAFDIAGVARHDARKTMTRMKLTLRPVAADRTDFPLEDGTNVKVILADIVELKIENKYTGGYALHKTFLNYRPAQPGSTSTLFSPELLDSISKKKSLK